MMKAFNYFGLFMIFVYALLGLGLIFIYRPEGMKPSNSIFLGVVLIAYAAFRAYSYSRLKKKPDSSDAGPDKNHIA